MAVLATAVLAALHLEHDDLVTLDKRVHHFYYYFCALNGGGTDSHCAVLVDEQHLVKLNSLAFLGVLDVMDEELLALFGFELLTVNVYDCVH